jgi:hypothetical protein
MRRHCSSVVKLFSYLPIEQQSFDSVVGAELMVCKEIQDNPCSPNLIVCEESVAIWDSHVIRKESKQGYCEGFSVKTLSAELTVLTG